EHHPDIGGMGAAADFGDVEKIAVGIAGGLEVKVRAASRVEPVAVFLVDLAEGLFEVVASITFKGLDGNVEIRLSSVPVVDQLMHATIDISTDDKDVLPPQQVGQNGVHGGHATTEVPRHVVTREGSCLEIDDMVGERDGSGIQQARIDFVQLLSAPKGIFNPLGAGIDVSGG